MKWRRICGLFLLLVSLVLAILLSAKLPFVKTNRFPLTNPIEVFPRGEPNNFYNLTLEPLGKEDYHVEVTISPYYMVDFWAVNAQGLGILNSFLELGWMFEEEYPDKYPYTAIMTYAKGVNITSRTTFELVNLTGNGVYCLVLLNFFDDPQNVSASVEERYLESYRTLLEPNLANITISAAIFTAGVYLIIRSQKRTAKRAKRLTSKA